MLTKLATSVAALGIAVAGAVAAAPAASAAVQPAYSCTIDSYSTVTHADWLKVHTQASTSSSSVGQLPRGAIFHFCSSSEHSSGGHFWVYGYGYNGSKKLTGWVAGEYLAWP